MLVHKDLKEHLVHKDKMVSLEIKALPDKRVLLATLAHLDLLVQKEAQDLQAQLGSLEHQVKLAHLESQDQQGQLDLLVQVEIKVLLVQLVM
jgi:hypothetical protein